MKKTAFYFGTIGGILMVLCFLTPYFIYGNNVDFSKGELIGYASMVFCLTTIFFGIKSYRDKKQQGTITFGKAFGLGSEISGIASIIFAIYSFLLYKVFAPELGPGLLDYYRQKIINSGASQQVIAEQLKQFEAQSDFYANPLAMAVVMLFTVFVIGLIISLISAFILKRKELKTKGGEV